MVKLLVWCHAELRKWSRSNWHFNPLFS